MMRLGGKHVSRKDNADRWKLEGKSGPSQIWKGFVNQVKEWNNRPLSL